MQMSPAELTELETRFVDLIRAASQYCSDGTPLPFVLAAAYIDYLSKLVMGEDKRGAGYRAFIKNHLSNVRKEYQTFTYASGAADLPDQMYSVLRCGLVHSFSMIPDKSIKNQKGRDRSIVLSHRVNLAPGGHHLMRHSGPQKLDAALFVLEDFLDDLEKVVHMIFAQARTDPTLAANIAKWVKQCPLLSGTY
jgi:hypothetical protein